jgi:hypothetical protein
LVRPSNAFSGARLRSDRPPIGLATVTTLVLALLREYLARAAVAFAFLRVMPALLRAPNSSGVASGNHAQPDVPARRIRVYTVLTVGSALAGARRIGTCVRRVADREVVARRPRTVGCPLERVKRS